MEIHHYHFEPVQVGSRILAVIQCDLKLNSMFNSMGKYAVNGLVGDVNMSWNESE
jgi:hypothetical protein